MCGLGLGTTDIGGKSRIACAACEFVHWDNPKPVTATLVPMDNGLVLVKRKFEPYIGDWCLPGGFIEATEHPAESAAREVLEETGLIIAEPRLIDATTPGYGINVVILFYVAKAVGGKLEAGDDASEVDTFSADKLPGNVAFELHRNIIKRFFDGHL
jgi:ADP-ribose pyrophosphatase YjhB (NUDIX family)